MSKSIYYHSPETVIKECQLLEKNEIPVKRFNFDLNEVEVKLVLDCLKNQSKQLDDAGFVQLSSIATEILDVHNYIKSLFEKQS